MSDRRIDVRVFDPELLRREIQAAERALRRSRRILPELPARDLAGSTLCAALIAALHTAVLAPLVFGGGTRADRHQPAQFSARAGASEDGALQVSFLDDRPARNQQAQQADLGIGERMLQPVTVDLQSLAVSPADPAAQDEAAGTGARTTSDVVGDSLMAGRYVGQIDARVDRAWLRPRTPIGAARFSCRVSIEQDAAGNVKEVELETCNGDARWQLSLVHAIEAASPLPAPPDPAVFRSELHLTFNAAAFRPGGAVDGYEPMPPPAAGSAEAPGPSLD